MSVCFINGSPRGNNSTSNYLIDLAMTYFSESYPKTIIQMSKLKTKEDIKNLFEYKNIVLVFPLYGDSLPSTLLDFLVELHKLCDFKENLPNLYAISNCGFLEGKQIHIAMEIMENYANRTGFNWRFGIGLGAGEAFRTTPFLPLKSPMKWKIHKAFKTLQKSIENNDMSQEKSIFVQQDMGKRMFMFMATKFMIKKGAKNGLSKEDLKRKVYKEN